MESNHSGTPNGRPTSLVSPPHLRVPGNSEDDSKRALARCSSLPDGINSPVQLRPVSSRSRKKAQNLRNSVAITSSDYYNQRRPQISQLAVVQQTHSPMRTTTAPLHPITENDSSERANKRSSMVVDMHDLNGLQITDSRLFRYRSTSSLGPPATSSRPTTPQVCNPQIDKVKRQLSTASSTSSMTRADSILSLNEGECTLSPTSGTPLPRAQPFSVLKTNSQAIPLTSATEDQFLPLYVNPESGCVYMFEDGYYIPLSPENVNIFQNTAKSSQPPIPDRRSKVSVTTQPHSPSRSKQQKQSSRIMDPPSDYLSFVQVLMVLYAVCFNLPVLVLCSVPALVCSFQVRKANRKGQFEVAKRLSECVMCFSVLGIVFHVFSVLAVMATFLLLHFLGGYFTI